MQTFSSVRGFTLIELMLVVAVVGILSIIAIPQYQNYAIRAKVSEGMQILAAAKTMVTEYTISQGKWPMTLQEAGVLSVATTFVAELLYTPDQAANTAVLSVRMRGTGNSNVDGKHLSFAGNNPSGSGNFVWKCRAGDTRGEENQAIPPEFLPGNCRKSLKS